MRRNKFMKKKESCEKLIKRWRELEKKKVRLQDYISGEDMKFSLTPEEMKELNDIKEKLKEECLEFLSSKEQSEVK